MEALGQQVITLSHKVDALYKAIEQLNDKLAESLSDNRPGERDFSERPNFSLHDRHSPSPSYSSLDPVLEHKDILLDDNSFDKSGQNLDKELTADIQIQRLTAQLTAAYNRIAALEEQLLSKRIHS